MQYEKYSMRVWLRDKCIARGIAFSLRLHPSAIFFCSARAYVMFLMVYEVIIKKSAKIQFITSWNATVIVRKLIGDDLQPAEGQKINL